MKTDDPSSHQPERPSRKSLPPWLWTLPLLLVIGFIWQVRRDTPQMETPDDKQVPAPAATATPVAPTPAPPKARSLIIFVPGDDALLHKRSIQEQTLPAGGTDAAPATRAVQRLLKSSPRDFPPGTRLSEVKTDGKVARVNLNRAFMKPDFWQGSTQTQMTIYSIVNTVAAQSDESLKVQFLIEGKPVEVLGEYDVSEPIEPKKELVAEN